MEYAQRGKHVTRRKEENDQGDKKNDDDSFEGSSAMLEVNEPELSVSQWQGRECRGEEWRGIQEPGNKFTPRERERLVGYTRVTSEKYAGSFIVVVVGVCKFVG